MDQKKAEQNEIKKLGQFLMGNFLLVLTIVSISEYYIFQLIQTYWLPIVYESFFQLEKIDVPVSNGKMIGTIAIIILELFLYALTAVFPYTVKVFLLNAIKSLEETRQKLMPVKGPGFGVAQLTTQKGFLLFLMVIAMLFLIFIPYIVGTIWYARITLQEIHRIEIRRDEIKREYDRKRNLMLSDIAHDLRTPITTISGYATALADGMIKDPEKQMEYYAAMQSKSKRINELIQLLFEYVKLDSEGFKLNLGQMDICELMRQNAALLYADIESAGMELDVDIPEEVYTVRMDEIQISRVVTNLLTNAMRHNSNGTHILLRLEKIDGYLNLIVADSGKTIAHEEAKHLFEPFFSGDESRSTKGGTGLGLSIAHKVAQMHGWELYFTEHYPQYTKAFVIQIPYSEIYHTNLLNLHN